MRLLHAAEDVAAGHAVARLAIGLELPRFPAVQGRRLDAALQKVFARDAHGVALHDGFDGPREAVVPQQHRHILVGAGVPEFDRDVELRFQQLPERVGALGGDVALEQERPRRLRQRAEHLVFFRPHETGTVTPVSPLSTVTATEVGSIAFAAASFVPAATLIAVGGVRAVIFALATVTAAVPV